jgi:serine/threonine protein kinase
MQGFGLSPEQIRSDRSPRSDIYSFGIAVVPALTGKPFPDEMLVALIEKHLRPLPGVT